MIFLISFMAALLDSSECHMHYCDFRHSLNVISLSLDAQRNEFLINQLLSTYKNDQF